MTLSGEGKWGTGDSKELVNIYIYHVMYEQRKFDEWMG